MSLLDDVAEAVAMESDRGHYVVGQWPTPLQYDQARRALEGRKNRGAD